MYVLQNVSVSLGFADARNVNENGGHLNHRYNPRSDNELMPAARQDDVYLITVDLFIRCSGHQSVSTDARLKYRLVPNQRKL